MTINNRVIEVMTISNSRFTYGFSGLLFAACLVFSTTTMAADGDKPGQEQLTEAQRQELIRQREEMMAAIEKSREEVRRVAVEAREKAEVLREEAQRLRADSADMARETEEARRVASRELAREREELSRTHRELRRASQEVARAHRELGLAEDRRIRTINLGDRAMIGVILGDETEEGVKIIGVSPDGPAERAGIQTGDTLTSIRGESLTPGEGGSSRDTIYRVLRDLGDGEEISIAVRRDDEQLDFMVKPEKREPTSWASYIRLPEPVVAPAPPGAVTSEVVAPHVLIEKIAVPPIDTAMIAAEALALTEELESFHIMLQSDGDDATQYSYSIEMDPSDFEFDTEVFSDFGAMAMDEARLWFGSGATMGLRFTDINEGLAAYFDTDKGVLVLEASEDNAFGLEAGDVVLKVGSSNIGETADLVRALRDQETGDQVEMLIRRNKSDVTLDIIIPENRFGQFDQHFSDQEFHATIAEKVIAD